MLCGQMFCADGNASEDGKTVSALSGEGKIIRNALEHFGMM